MKHRMKSYVEIEGGSERPEAGLQRLRILEFTIDHEAPYFSKMRRRTSRRDSDLNGVVDVRYTGGARMLLLIEAGSGRWRFKVSPWTHTFMRGTVPDDLCTGH